MSALDCPHLDDPEACDCVVTVHKNGEFTITMPDRSITYTKVVGMKKGIYTITLANGPVDIHWEDED